VKWGSLTRRPAGSPSFEAASAPNPSFNRSFEFNGLNRNLVRFLIQELFPEVDRHQTPEGLPNRLS
jgi:hypothetical protein